VLVVRPGVFVFSQNLEIMVFIDILLFEVSVQSAVIVAGYEAFAALLVFSRIFCPHCTTTGFVLDIYFSHLHYFSR